MPTRDKRSPHDLQPDLRQAVRDVIRVAGQLRPFDPADVLVGTAALQLMPENAHRAIRLHALTHAAALGIDSARTQGMELVKLRELVNTPPLSEGPVADAEDPLENHFCESFTFFGGSYMVLGGIFSEPAYVLSRLCEGLFMDNNPALSLIREEALLLVQAVLLLSDEIARRAGLVQGIEIPSPAEKATFVPPLEQFERLKQAVTFEEGDLSVLLGDTPLSVMESLISEHTTPEGYAFGGGELEERPLIRLGGRLIVAYPGALLHATRRRLVALATAHRCQHALAHAFGRATLRNVVASFDRLRNPPATQSYHHHWSDKGCFHEALFQTDVDRFTLLLLATDPLSKRHVSHIQLKAHSYLAGRQKAFQRLQRQSKVLLVVLGQAIARPIHLQLGPAHGLASDALYMSAAELEVITEVAEGNPLALWKYARARQQLHKRFRVIAFGALDEFYAYRQQDDSYYLSDEKAEVLWIKPGGSWLLRREAQRIRNYHGATSWKEGTIEVERTYRHEQMPIYMPRGGFESGLALLVEGLPVPIWVLPLHDVDRQSDWLRWSNTYNFCDLICFWLWQSTSSLKALLAGAGERYSVIRFKVDPPPVQALVMSDSEPVRPDLSEPSLTFQVDREQAEIQVRLGTEFAKLLNEPGNQADRRLLRTVIEALLKLLEGNASHEQLEQIVERHAPLGMKKRLQLGNTADSPDLDPRQLPDLRPVQAHDLAELREVMSTAIAAKLSLQPGPVPVDSRGKVLKAISGFYYEELRRIVASLSPEHLLEMLITCDEAITHRRARERHTVPGRSAFSELASNLIGEVAEDVTRTNQAAAASRVLIEFVAAQPPGGTQQFSLEAYDQVLALASLIQQVGFDDDSLYYDLDEVDILLTSSGHLRHGASRYMEAQQQYMLLHASGEIERALDQMAETSSKPGLASPEEEEELKHASREEFGLSLYDLLAFAGELIALGMKSGQAVSKMMGKELEQHAEEQLSWPRESIRQAIDVLSLKPRESFLQVEAPFRKEDVYPWRMNRRLGYLGRPLVRRESLNGSEFLWGHRHVYVALQHLTYLCLTGRLQARTLRMQRYLSQRQQLLGNWFNDQVATFFSSIPGMRVITRAEKFSGLRLRGQLGDLGDIDVLAVDETYQWVWAVECKHLHSARTPYELRGELQNLLEGKGEANSVVYRHARRVEWLRQHLEPVLQSLGSSTDGNWRVAPLIVVEREVLSPHLRSSPIPIVPLHMLERHRASGHSLMDIVTAMDNTAAAHPGNKN